MAQETSSPDWSTRLALSIAAEVRRHRQAQGLSAQQLSDRCASIGMPIQRSVLANLESGRRTTVTVAEVLVLAHALGVPPGVLMFPVGYERQCEAQPGGYLEPVVAVDWLSGRHFIDQDVADGFFETPLGVIRLHQDAVRKLQQQLRKRSDAARRVVGLENDCSGVAELIDRLEAEMHFVDAQLREMATPGLIGGDEHDRLTYHREVLSSNLMSARHRAEALEDQCRYAKALAAAAEEEVQRSGAAVRAHRDKLAAMQLSLPLLPRELSYLAPDTEFLEDIPERPKIDFSVKSDPLDFDDENAGWGRVMDEGDGRQDSVSLPPEDAQSEWRAPQNDAFTQPREAYSKVEAEEIAEALARVLERKGMRLVRKGEDEGEGRE